VQQRAPILGRVEQQAAIDLGAVVVAPGLPQGQSVP